MTKNSKTRNFVIITIIILIVFVVIFKTKPQTNYPMYKIKKGNFLIDINTKGTVKAIKSNIVNSPSRIWGNIRIIKLVDEGTYVKKNDFLIQFDPAEFQERLQRQENDLEKAKANMESKIANIEKQDADYQSQLKIEEYSFEQTKLRAKNAIYESENKRKDVEYSLKKADISYNRLIEKIEKTKEINKASMRQAELQVEQAALMLKRAQEELDQLTIFSPAEGLVVYKEIWGSSGKEKVKVGSTPWRNQPLLEIPDQSKMKVVLNVNEVDISNVQKNQNVNIKLDAITDTSFTGTITSIAALAHKDRATEKKVFEIEVNINEYDERLKPGMSANCQIIVEEIENSIFIPLDAIYSKDGKTGVLNSSGKFIPITTGKSNSDFIIISKGLKDGDDIRLMKMKSTEQRHKPKSTNTKSKRGSERRIIIHG